MQTEKREEQLYKSLFNICSGVLSCIGGVKHQIESYNDLISNYIPSLFDNNDVFHMKVSGTFHNASDDSPTKEVAFEFRNIFFEPPFAKGDGYVEIGSDNRLFPIQCIHRGLSYTSSVYVDVIFTDTEGVIHTMKKLHIGEIPVMVCSNLCNIHICGRDPSVLYPIKEDIDDYGGYFILDGVRRVLVMQEKNASNRIYLYKRKEKDVKLYKATVKDCGQGRIKNHDLYCEVKSFIPQRPLSLSLFHLGVYSNSACGLYCTIPHVPRPHLIPLIVLFRALGFENNMDIIDLVVDETDTEEEGEKIIEFLTSSFEYAYNCKSREDALSYINSRCNTEKKYDENMEALFPHIIPISDKPKQVILQKALFLGRIVRKLANGCMGRIVPDDRDHFKNKVVHTPCTMLGFTFFSAFKKLCKEISEECKNSITIGNDLISQKILSIISRKKDLMESTFHMAMIKDRWFGDLANSTGVCQLYERFNYISTMSNARKICLNLNAHGSSTIKPRSIHGSHEGLVCASETPEGKKAGLIRNLALFATISLGCDPLPIKDFLSERLSPLFGKRKDRIAGSLVYLNGSPIGTTKDSDSLAKFIRKSRKQRKISHELSISYSRDGLDRDIFLYCDVGRLYRPLLVLRNNKFPFDLKDYSKRKDVNIYDLLLDGLIEFIDAAEAEDKRICLSYHTLYPKEGETYEKYRDHTPEVPFTHCVLDSTGMLGYGISFISFPDKNHAPRNSYESNMAKQSIGIPYTNFMYSFENKMNVMRYPQKPLVTTKASYMAGKEDVCMSFNPIVAICSFYGFGQEDAIIYNRSSLDRGMATIDRYYTYSYTTANNEAFGIPKKNPDDPGWLKDAKNLDRINPYCDISKLDHSGFPAIGTKVEQGDTIISVITDPYSENPGMKTIKYNERVQGYIDKIQIGEPKKGSLLRYVKISIIQSRRIISGDKAASLSSQKGVAGMIVNQEDLPFTSDGITPDIIINPLAFPSRMTASQLVECVLGKAVCLKKDTDKHPINSVFGRKDSLGRMTGDGSPFNPDLKFQEIEDELRKAGYSPSGKEMLYDGITGRQLKCLFIGPVTYQRLKHMINDKTHCLTMDYEVLTDKGWRKYGQLEGAKIASLDKYGVLEYVEPLAILYYPDYFGAFYSLRDDEVDIKVTANHRLIDWRGGPNFIEAADAYGSDIVHKRNCIYKRDRYIFSEKDGLRENLLLSHDSWLLLYGILCCNDVTYTDPIFGEVHLKLEKDLRHVKFDNMMDLLGINHRREEGEIVLVDRNLHRYVICELSQNKENMKLHDWVWNLDSRQCKLLIIGLLNGKYCEGENKIFRTRSERLADEFSIISLRAGWYCDKTFGITEDGFIYYECSLKTLGNEFVVDRNKPYYEEMYISFEPVFCLEVPNETFYVRRNGKCMWTGNSRGKGMVTAICRQPMSGKAKDGGFKTGIMERDSFISSGASASIRDRLFEQTDPFKIWVCDTCGLPATMNAHTLMGECRVCQRDDISYVNIPFGSKLLMQELISIGVVPRLMTENRDNKIKILENL